MAQIRPFAAWRYAKIGRDLSAVTAPPYDVVPPEMRTQLLARDPYNAVALELPSGSEDPSAPDSRYVQGKATWDEWRGSGFLAQDEHPTIYVLEQSGTYQGRAFRRRGFIAEVALEPFSAGVVLPHEQTLPKAIGDRFELIRATEANLSQILGLFEDPDNVSIRLFDELTVRPADAEATDADGVLSRLWSVTDTAVIDEIVSLLAPSRVFIADGHHRYKTSLAYREYRRAKAAGEPVPSDVTEALASAEAATCGCGCGCSGSAGHEAAYDFIMVALVSIDDPELTILPTHRVVRCANDFDSDGFLAELRQRFDVVGVAEGGQGDPYDAFVGISEDVPAFLIQTSPGSPLLRATLHSDVSLDEAISADMSLSWKSLDVTVLAELILNPLLGISINDRESLKRLSFAKDPRQALSQATDRDLVFIMRATRLDQMKTVSLGGEVMPQKSTYFYPKLLTGLVFRSTE
ncbi:MAG: DUF1015 domain-containing protein [Coriobacteriia bacterium]|nr:DUF1015 domain-containing protein [Coriobacteriia bacterium]